MTAEGQLAVAAPPTAETVRGLSGQPMFPGGPSFYPDPDARLTLPGRLASMLLPTAEEAVRPR